MGVDKRLSGISFMNTPYAEVWSRICQCDFICMDANERVCAIYFQALFLQYLSRSVFIIISIILLTLMFYA
jgi:hypothetical protein